MSSAANLKIGDVIPSSMGTKYSSAVLAVSLKEAMDIAKFDMPPTSPLSSDDIAAIKEIYSEYQTHNAYWNKNESDNKAFWDNQSGG